MLKGLNSAEKFKLLLLIYEGVCDISGYKDIFDIESFPYMDRGMPNDKGQFRKLRIIASPYTTEDDFAVVHVQVPKGTSSPGHIHPDFEEVILFKKSAKVKLNDEEVYAVPENGIFVVRSGVYHEILASEFGDSENLCLYLPKSEHFNLPESLIKETNEYLYLRSQNY